MRININEMSTKQLFIAGVREVGCAGTHRRQLSRVSHRTGGWRTNPKPPSQGPCSYEYLKYHNFKKCYLVTGLRYFNVSFSYECNIPPSISIPTLRKEWERERAINKVRQSILVVKTLTVLNMELWPFLSSSLFPCLDHNCVVRWQYVLL